MEMRGMMGESLGTIGESTQPLPQWKKDFLSKPSTSIRKGIAWGTNPSYEDTDTLVLTSHSSKFVDVRFPLSTKNPYETGQHPSFWAFSGEAHITFYDPSSSTLNPHQPESQYIALPYIARCQFLHDIDTRGPGIIDQGDMCLLPNGDCLEFGIMMNPATGYEESYKEYWTSAPKLPFPDGISDSQTCIVAQTASPSNVEGLMIRIGGRIQGILSRQNADGTETVEVERWIREGMVPWGAPEWEIIGQGVPLAPRPKGWYRDHRSSGMMPCAWLCGPINGLGENHEHNGVLWNIIELAI